MNHLPRILFVHNRYQHSGGEDSVVASEMALLNGRGHAVDLYERSNFDIDQMSMCQAGVQTIWSTRTTREIGDLLRRFKPDVVHVHNVFPLISPSVYWAASKAGVPVVQTLHNFRLLCPQAMLLRNGRVCEDCVGKLPWRGVVHRCYRGSASGTSVAVGMLSFHRMLGTWRTKVRRYVALNEFCRRKFISGGLPADRIVVKPHFVDAVPACERDVIRNGYLFVGRLVEEKGIAVLAEVAVRLPSVNFKVAGEGPLQRLLTGLRNVELLGRLDRTTVYSEMQRARALIMPSIWNETFGLVALEALCCGLPVIGSAMGGIADIIQDAENGFLVEPGQPESIVSRILELEADVELRTRLGRMALRHSESYSADSAYDSALALYAFNEDVNFH